MAKTPVFIAWAGPRSRAVATELRAWLPHVLQATEPFMSEEDVRAGAGWFEEISDRLRVSAYAVLCVTPDNLENPWLHFEGGAIGMRPRGLGGDTPGTRSAVAPYLLGLEPSALKLPLSMYQSKRADHDGTRDLVKGINAVLGLDALAEPTLTETFDVWWPRLEERLKEIEQLPAQAAPREREVNDVLNEILGLVRQLAREQASTNRQRWLRDLDTGGAAARARRAAAIEPEQRDALHDLDRQLALAMADLDAGGAIGDAAHARIAVLHYERQRALEDHVHHRRAQQIRIITEVMAGIDGRTVITHVEDGRIYVDPGDEELTIDQMRRIEDAVAPLHLEVVFIHGPSADFDEAR